MTWRSIASVLLGFALWWFLFLAVGIGFGAIWPEYREAARLMFQEGDLSGFRTPLLFMNFVLFIVVGLVVGWVAAVVGKSRIPVLVLASVLLIYAIVNHYILEWDQFPAWYNLIVPLVVSGPIVLGHRFVGKRSDKADA
jgi:hypothetical protein